MVDSHTIVFGYIDCCVDDVAFCTLHDEGDEHALTDEITKEAEEKAKKKFKLMFGFEPEGYIMKKTVVKRNEKLLNKLKKPKGKK